MSDDALRYQAPDVQAPRPRIRSGSRARNAGERANSGTAANVRYAARAMLVAFAVVLLFNSGGAARFARDLPGNAATDVLVDAADRWHGLMQRLGPAQLGPAVRDAFARIHDLRWRD